MIEQNGRVYIHIEGRERKIIYVGSSESVRRRLKQHAYGYTLTTRAYGEVELGVFSEVCDDRKS